MGRLDVVIAILRYAKPDMKLDVNMFNDRLRLQKYVYIIEKLGVDLGYNFTGYLRGPYTPDLANDYYSRSDDISHLRSDHVLTEKEREVAEKMKEVVTLDDLELEALVMLLDKGWLYDDNAITNLHFIKPHLHPFRIKRAMEVGRKIFQEK